MSYNTEISAPRVGYHNVMLDLESQSVPGSIHPSVLPALAQAMPCALVGLDANARVSFWNPAAERLLGWRAGEAIGQAWTTFIAPASGLIGNLNGHAEPRIEVCHKRGQRLTLKLTPLATSDPQTKERHFFLEPVTSVLESTRHVVREVLDLLPAYFSFMDRDLIYRLVCRCCEKLFGRPRSELEGQRFLDLVGPEIFARLEPYLQRALAGEPVGFEAVLPGADGEDHVLRIYAQPIQQAGRVEGVFLFSYEITELRQAEATLRHSESRLKTIVENNPDLVAIIDRDHVIRFVNHLAPDPEARKEDVLGLDIIALALPEYRDWVRDQYELVWENGKSRDIESPIVWKGEVRWFSSRLVALPHEDGAAANIMVVAREITQRIAMDKALQESEARFRQFAEALDDVIWIHEMQPERISFINRAFERVWGLSRQALFHNATAWISTIHSDDQQRVMDHWAHVIRKDDPFDIEYRIVRPDNTQRWIHDTGVAIRDEAGKVIRLTGIARDITARKQMDEDKDVFQRQLLETQKLESLGVLAGGIAHDFNNLLTGILGNVNLAQLEIAHGSNLRTFLDQIESISLRASDLCKQMLAYAGKGRFVVTPSDLNELIEEITHLLNISISKKARLDLHLAADLPAIQGDASQLRQVLLNLVINASEALGDKVGVIRIATGLAELMNDDLATFQFGAEMVSGTYVFLEVGDNASGMDAAVLERIFEPFFTTKFTGRGLGLAAVQGIIRSHGGAIRVTSKVGKGTVFTLLLPHSGVPMTPPDPIPIAAPFHGQGELLIVDDESIIRTTLAHMLKSLGFTVHTACNGREALTFFERHHATLDLVLLDLTMPQLSGEETFREMARINSRVPVILMSGYMEQEMAGRFVGQAIAGFLQKPFRMETLEDLLKETLQAKHG